MSVQVVQLAVMSVQVIMIALLAVKDIFYQVHPLRYVLSAHKDARIVNSLHYIYVVHAKMDIS